MLIWGPDNTLVCHNLSIFSNNRGRKQHGGGRCVHTQDPGRLGSIPALPLTIRVTLDKLVLSLLIYKMGG